MDILSRDDFVRLCRRKTARAVGGSGEGGAALLPGGVGVSIAVSSALTAKNLLLLLWPVIADRIRRDEDKRRVDVAAIRMVR